MAMMKKKTVRKAATGKKTATPLTSRDNSAYHTSDAGKSIGMKKTATPMLKKKTATPINRGVATTPGFKPRDKAKKNAKLY